MRIAYVLMQFPTPSEAFASLEIKSAIRSGHSVEVFCMSGRHADSDHLIRARNLEEIPIHNVSDLKGRVLDRLQLKAMVMAASENDLRGRAGLFRYSVRAATIAKLILERDFDVVNLYWGHVPSMVGLLVKQSQPRIAVNLCLRAYDLRMGLEVSKRMIQAADGCVVNAHASVARIVELGAPIEKVSVIYDGVDTEAFASIPKTSRDRNAVLTVGRLIYDKGFHLVLDAFAEAYREFPLLELKIAGNGPEKANLTRQAERLGIAHRVTFLGHLNQKALFQEMQSCGTFMLLSRVESLPNVVKEAALAGAAIITSETAGIRELIPNDQCGFVVPIDDSRISSQRLREIFADPNLARQLGCNVKEHIESAFDIRATLAQYVELWSREVDRVAKWPGGKKFAFTIVDDTDEGTLRTAKPFYDLLIELGFIITKTVWVYPSRNDFGGSSLSDPDYRDWVLSLQEQKFEIALHGVGSGAFTREEILAGLDIYRKILGSYPTMQINHANNPDNLYFTPDDRFIFPFSLVYAIRALFMPFDKKERHVDRKVPTKTIELHLPRPGCGQDPSSPNFWGDWAKAHIKYVRNLTFSNIDTLEADPKMPYIVQANNKFSNYWFSSSDAFTVDEFLYLTRPSNVDKLIRNRGCCIVYSHSAYGFVENGKVREDVAKQLRYIASKAGWFAPASEVLDHILEQTGEQKVQKAYLFSLALRWHWQRLMRFLKFRR